MERDMTSNAADESGDVLVVAADRAGGDDLAEFLSGAGHAVRAASDRTAAVAAARHRLPELVVLDLDRPGHDGFDVFYRIRELGPVRLIVISARASLEDRILGLELGADDYLAKPVSPVELALRVRSVLRRAPYPPTSGGAAEIVRHGDLEVNLTRHEARCAARVLTLTVREFNLLAFLVAHPRRVFSRYELMRRVWGWELGDESTITVHMRRLRTKIEPDPAAPRFLHTVRGVGYRLDDLGSNPPAACRMTPVYRASVWSNETGPTTRGDGFA